MNNRHLYSIEKLKKKSSILIEKWGIDIDIDLMILALTHRSFAHEAGNIPTNERLEFLGDSILGLIVTENLYRKYPDTPEGKLAQMRAATVSQTALATVARTINLSEYILLGKGEKISGGSNKDSILSDVMESLIAATYLCHGMDKTRVVVENLLQDLLENVVVRGAEMDWKTTLQELTALHGKSYPVYTVEGEGPDHNRTYYAEVVVENFVYGHGKGSSKKNAEQNAAQMAAETITRNFITD